MNEPIINPWFFYWADVLCSLKIALFALFTMGFAGVTILVFEYNDKLQDYERDNEYEPYIKRFERAKKWLTQSVICVLATTIALIFLPSRETVVKMFIAQQITQQNLNVAGETVEKLIDKAVEKIIEVKKVK